MSKKKGALTLLFALVLAVGLCGQAMAAITFTATGGNTVASQKAGATNVVLAAFTAEENGAGSDNITHFYIDNAGGASGLGAELAKLSIYRDVNGDTKFDSGDTLVGGATTAATTNYTVGGVTVDLTPTSPESFAINASKKYLVVADFSKADGGIVDNHTFGAAISGTATSGAIAAVTQTAVTLPIMASHLRFLTAGYAPQVTTGGEILITGQNLLAAVDDYGNTDVDFTEVVRLSAVDYSTLASISDDLTAKAGVGGATDVKTTGVAMTAGFLPNNTGGAAGAMFTLKHSPTTAGPVTLVATSNDKKLEGSVTICNGTYPTSVPVINPARGIEVYDVNHNGKIDHMTVFFDTPVNPNGVLAGDFNVGSEYTLSGTPVGSFDAGGVGIRNAGQYGVTVTLNEKADVYDTNVKPDLTYLVSNKIQGRGAGTPFVSAFGTAQAVEVDKARPILISAVTKDAGIGAGTATNGILDGIVLTFSEPVRNVLAGTVLSGDTATSGIINLALPVSSGMSFNQGYGTVNGNVVTIPVSETTINTGITPKIDYNEYATGTDPKITDFATSAIGAPSYNKFYATNTQFASADTQIETTDGAPMVVHSVETLDLNSDGRLDAIRVTFSENAFAPNVVGVDFYSSVAVFASGTNRNGIYTPTSVSGSSTPTLTYTITPVALAENVYDTEATPSFRYDPTMIDASLTPSNLCDGVGNELGAYGPGGLSHAPTKDMAAPVIVKILTGDAYADTSYAGNGNFIAEGANGRLDNVKLVFSEKVQTTEGAQFGGASLDNALGQFTINHALGAGRTKMATTATIGKPAWSDIDANGDNRTEVVVTFQELPVNTAGMVNGGDTGATVTVVYAPSGTSKYNVKDYGAEPNLLHLTLPTSTDGAAPFIVDGIGRGWGANAFANVLTYDKPEDLPNSPARAVGNNGKGNGLLEGFELKFTENVTFNSTTGTNLKQFATTVIGGGTLTFNDATAAVTGNGTSTIILTGKRTKAGDYDTGTTPMLTYTQADGTLTVTDTVGNKLASFTDKPSYDGAPPAVVGVNGDVTQANKLNFTFSEPVYAHDADGKSISFNAAAIASSILFGYDNLGSGPGSSGFTAAPVTQPSPTVLQATLNANLTVVDIENDLVWVKVAQIFDDADIIETGLTDNVVANSVAGAAIKIWIMDDVIAPWIVNMSTVDQNLNGKIDHIRVELSENIDDSTLKGYVSANAMSNDVSGTWILSGYNGPVRWNLFDGTTNEGKLAAINAGKPAFSDNDTDDNILYLELDENLVPVNPNTGIGSTAFKPTVTWGIGANAETLGDFRPNLLNTNADPDKTTPKATNGVVVDKVGPAIVGATISGKDITVQFSEDVKNKADVTYAEYFLVDNSAAKIWGLNWLNNSTVVLTMKSDYSFSTSVATTVAVNSAAPDLTDLADSASNPAGLSTDVFKVYDRPTDTMVPTDALWNVASPASVTPYTPKAYTRGAFNVTNNAYITFRDFSDTKPVAGQSVRIRWYCANVDSVDLYVSFNGGQTYTLESGYRTAASAGQLYWNARMGVTDVKVQSASSSVGAVGTLAAAVTFDNVYNSAIGAPSDLTITDMPGDNGGFVIAKFKVSADNLTAVNSYQFFREMTVGESTMWVLWATVPATAPDANGYMAVIVPTVTNVTSNWGVCSSTAKPVSNIIAASKEAELPVAEVVYDGGVGKAAVDAVSAMSNVVEGASIDNIAPSALITVSATTEAGSGVRISWVSPEDHGIVASYTLAGVTNYIYGVDKYEVYRKTGDGEFELVGEAIHGSTSYTDGIAPSSTVYQYLVKAVDSAHAVETVVPGNLMATSGVVGDLTGDTTVGLGDLVILGSYWGSRSTDPNFVAALDLNKDGEIGLGDLVLLGSNWTPASKVAKAAPEAIEFFTSSAEYNSDNSIYYVTVNAKDVAGVNGIAFSLKYDAAKYEFVKEIVSGLSGDIKIINDAEGIVDIASYYGSEQFRGAITLGFKPRGQIAEMNIEMVNAEVAINGVVSAVSTSAVTLKAVPTVYSLSQNVPNPFNPTTTIAYSIPKAGHVSLAVYNIAGQKVRTLVNESQSAANYKVVWNGKNDNGESVATGMYFYRLVSGNYSKIVKMTLMK